MAVVRIGYLNQRFIKVRGKDKLEIIMIKIDIKIGIDQIAEIGECHIGAEVSVDKTIEEGHSMIKIIELTLEEKILEEHKIIEVRILEVDIEVTLETITLEEVEVGLEKDSIQVTSEKNERSSSVSRSGSRESANRDRIRCLNVGSMIIFPKIVWKSDTEKEQSEEIQQILNLEEDKTLLKVLAINIYEDLIRANSEKTIDY